MLKRTSSFRYIVCLAINLFLILFLLVGCIGQPNVTTPDGIPLIWKVTDSDKQILYLFGSIHAADETTYPLPAVITEAFNSSDYLAVEVDINAFERDADAIRETALITIYPEGKTIADDIGTELHEKLKALLTELAPESLQGYPLETLDNLKPYGWSSLLTNICVERAGLSVELGLDKYFLNEAENRGMEILEIESFREQLNIMLGFSPALQAATLESYLDMDESALGLENLYNFWKQGDGIGIEGLMTFPEMTDELSTEYIDSLITQRNLRMAEVAERYMSEGKTVFYVVGAGHMIGDGGIVELLTQRGYTVERIK